MPSGSNDVLFSPDGRRIVVAGTNDYIDANDRRFESGAQARFILWQSQDLIDEACKRLTRNLTEKEWSDYLADEPYSKTCLNLP